MQIEAGRDRPGGGRSAPIAALLADALTTLTAHGRLPAVLDCGGGSGSIAVPLARAGADVTVVDISADALAILAHRADEAGVADRVHPLQGDVENLPAAVLDSSFDLVLAHGVLEAVDDLDAAFRGCVRAVRPGGLLSVLVSNPAAGVLARALAGETVAALGDLRALDGPAARVGPAGVLQLCERAGLSVEARHGVGVFSDLVPGGALHTPSARDALADLDAEAAERFPFTDIAARVHVRARRPA